MFYMPARVFSGYDAIKDHAEALTSLGRKALIVMGRGSARKNGSFFDVVEVLDNADVEFECFEGIKENPTVESVMEARDFGVENGCDFVIGIGGGSAMDAAKAIALMMKHYDEPWEYLYDKEAASDMLPLAEVPTTCGTGSEATAVSVLTRTDLNTKKSSVHKLFPTVSFVDGKYLKTAPKSIINNTAMDALAHMVEGSIHRKATEYTKMCAAHGLELWKSFKPILLGEKDAADEDFQKMMDASAMAGMTIAQTGTTIPHGLSYPITIGCAIPHGKCVSYFQSEFIRAMEKEDRDWILNRAGFTDPDELNDFFVKVCAPEEIPLEFREKAYEELKSNPAKLSAVPYEITDDILKRIAGIQA